jgi:tRNA U34 5-carboxymethylaminomethyl modifying GTPase MnmE/TrmE
MLIIWGGEYKLVDVTTYEIEGVGASYTFKADIDLDLLVVESSNGLGIVKVIEVFEDNIKNKAKAKKATAWVVDKIDYSRQSKRKEASERKEYIINKLEDKKEQLEAIKMYSLIDDLGPEAGKLVEELKTSLIFREGLANG